MSILSRDTGSNKRHVANGMIVRRSDFVAALIELETLASFIEGGNAMSKDRIAIELTSAARQFRALMTAGEQ